MIEGGQWISPFPFVFRQSDFGFVVFENGGFHSGESI